MADNKIKKITISLCDDHCFSEFKVGSDDFSFRSLSFDELCALLDVLDSMYKDCHDNIKHKLYNFT